MSDDNPADEIAAPDNRRGVIDQMEGDLATIVFDDNQQFVVQRDQLPSNARVGDVVVIGVKPKTALAAQALDAESEPEPSAEIDVHETEAAKQRVRDLINDIFKRPR